MRFLTDALVGAGTGVISGFGVGGGTLLVLYLTLFEKTSQLSAQGINLVYFIPCAIFSLISHIKNRQIERRAWIFSGAFGVASALIAAYVASMCDTAVLSRIFGVFLILAGAWEIISVIRGKKIEKGRGEAYNKGENKT